MRKDTGLSPRVHIHIQGEPGNRAIVNVVLCYLHSLTNQGPQDGGSKGFRMKLKVFVGFSNLVYVLLQCVQGGRKGSMYKVAFSYRTPEVLHVPGSKNTQNGNEDA